MALNTGTRLGPYEIVAPLGAGGMGEVYRARDTRLDRTVAVKVMPAHLAADPQFRERFDREARAVSALDHPNICALYDVGHHEGHDFLVMQYLEGETLAQRLLRGALSVGEALQVAMQVCSALAAAHRQGIVHRDLKPGNVMLTKGGATAGVPQAKLLDFGLARQATPGEPLGSLTLAPTGTAPLTNAGMILGTLQYMAPEQLEGRPADARSDIFSFGVVLFEMLTGRKAFAGSTPGSIIGAILHTEPPPVSTIQALTPPTLDRIVRKCLAKDPDARWQTAVDLRDALTWMAEPPTSVTSSSTQAPLVDARSTRASGWIGRAAWVLGGLLLGAGLVTASYRWLARPDSRPAGPESFSFAVAPPPDMWFGDNPTDPQPSVSPNGRQLLFAPRDKAGTQFWIRPMDSVAAKPLAGTKGVGSAFWAPDSRRIGFCANRAVTTLDVTSGPPAAVATGCSGNGSWSTRDQILFTAPDGLMQVAASGGTPARVTSLDKERGEASHWYPAFLPDGEHFVFLIRSANPDVRGIYVGSLDGTVRQRLVADDSRPVVAAGGRTYLLFVRGATLLAQRLDVATLKLEGDAVPLADKVGLGLNVRAGAYSASPTVLVHRSGGAFQSSRLVWFDRAGVQSAPLDTGETTSLISPDLSPDGRAVLYGRFNRDTNAFGVWRHDLGRNVSQPLHVIEPFSTDVAKWAPDGQRYAFGTNLSGSFNLAEHEIGGRDRELTANPTNEFLLDWSRDGKDVIFLRNGDIWALSPSGAQEPFPVVEGRFGKLTAELSPDGRWLAYTSTESDLNVYVQRFPRGPRFRVTAQGGSDPRWRQDGRELFYLGQDGTLYAVPVGGNSDTSFEVGSPRKLFTVPLGRGFVPTPRTNYAATADGQRFLFNLPIGEAAPLTVVTNWMRLVERREDQGK